MDRSPAPRDLLTILYQPRETMQRVLAARDRWTVPIVILAFLCASITDGDLWNIGDAFPGGQPLGIGAIAVLGLLCLSLTWVLGLFIAGWVAVLIGRPLGGSGRAADIRAALAWGLVPVIWSAFARIPIAIHEGRFHTTTRLHGREAILNFMAHGGCAFAVAVFALQLIVFAYWLYVTSCTIAEAQNFSPAKGFANIAIAIVAPLVVAGAAVFAFH